MRSWQTSSQSACVSFPWPDSGLRTVAALHPIIAAVADRAIGSSLDDFGSAAFLSDIASMRHEEQYSRVFRT